MPDAPLSRTDTPAIEHIGRYRIVGRLARGAMGVVYRARDDKMGRDVALKVMMPDADGSDTARERFMREARLTGRLMHRNIVTIYNMAEEDGRPYIVMELLEGRTLSEWLVQKTPSLEQKIDVMIQVCDGLAVAHTAGVIHRDIKPSNLFVTEDGSLKILDFGVARLASSNATRVGLIVGTPDYMSPEQARGQDVDVRSDVFSAAAVFYFMLANRKPFEGPGLPIVLHKVVHDPPPPIEAGLCPPALARIVMKGLAKAPDDRYPGAADLVADLVRFKRQFDAETRTVAQTVRARESEARHVGAELAALRAGLELPMSSAEAGWLDLERRLFGATPTGAAALKGGPAFLRSREGADRAVADLDRVVADLGRERDALARVTAALAQAEEAITASDGAKALAAVASAEAAIGSDVSVVQRLAERARSLTGAAEQVQAHVDVLLDEARRAEVEQAWAVVQSRAAEVLALVPEDPDARGLALRARAALEADRALGERQVHRLCERAEAAIRAGQFEAADEHMAAARRIDPASERGSGARSFGYLMW